MTDVVIPVAALVTVFLGVCMVALFAFLLDPEASGHSVYPWMFAVLGSLLMSVACWGIARWQLERERLRNVYGGNTSAEPRHGSTTGGDGQMRGSDQPEVQEIPVTDVMIPVAGFGSVFAAVCSVGLFAFLLDPKVGENPAYPWIFAVQGTLLMFLGCWGIVRWQLERERLRSLYGG